MGSKEGWEYYHEHDAALIRRDGFMCEQHAGVEWPHGDCAGPGQAWVVEGKENILTALTDARREQEWQPIETAPLGVQVLIHNPKWDAPIQMVRLKDTARWVESYGPTHWMLLPAPPKESNDK